MKKCIIFIVMTFISIPLLAISVLADIPQLINFQGTLYGGENNPLTGEYEITFRIYKLETGGTPLWAETISVNCENGLYDVILGLLTPLQLGFDGDYWIGVQVTGDTEMIPRYRIVSVPVTIRAAIAESAIVSASALDAQKLNGKDGSEFAEADHHHNDRYYTETELNSNDGVVNQSEDPVSWYKIKNIPDGFMDGIDDGGSNGWIDEGTDVILEGETDNVGIGTVDPEFRLDVKSSGPGDVIGVTSSDDDPLFKIRETSNGHGGIYVCDENGGNTVVIGGGGNTYFDAGNVGIGTNNPSYKLDVNGGINASSFKIEGENALSCDGVNIFLGGQSGVNGAMDPGDGATFLGYNTGKNNEGIFNTFVGFMAGVANIGGQYNTFLGCNSGLINQSGSDNTYIGFAAGSDTYGSRNTFIGCNTGNGGTENTYVGFQTGIDNYGSRNTFIGSYAGTGISGGTGNIFIGYGAGSNEQNDNKLYIENTDSDNPLIYGDFGRDFLAVNGALGIGTQNPDQDLEIDGNNSIVGLRLTYGGDYPGLYGEFRQEGSYGLIINSNAGGGWADIRLQTDGSTKIFIESGGNVGVGTVSPSYKLDVNGTIRGDNVSPSDVRLKKNIVTLDHSLEKVTSLRGVNFRWRDEKKDENFQIGVIAQEVEEVFPEVVTTDIEGYKAVAYGRLIAPMIEAIKELTAENEELRQRIETLEKDRMQ